MPSKTVFLYFSTTDSVFSLTQAVDVQLHTSVVALSWDEVAGAVLYQIEMREKGQDIWQIAGNSGAVKTQISGIASDTKMEFRVVAMTKTLRSDFSAVVEVRVS